MAQAARPRPGVDVDVQSNGGPPCLLTADDLAARWRVPRSWVYLATRDGRIPAVRLGRYYRYRLDGVEEFERAGGVIG